MDRARLDPRYFAAMLAPAGSDADGRDWQDRGSCQAADPEVFFPDEPGSCGPAVAVCRRCPVQDRCLLAAIQTRQTHGVWGATTPKERKPMIAAYAADYPEKG